jgi:hypothetical protein
MLSDPANMMCTPSNPNGVNPNDGPQIKSADVSQVTEHGNSTQPNPLEVIAAFPLPVVAAAVASEGLGKAAIAYEIAKKAYEYMDEAINADSRERQKRR